jgi:multidrug transporter EmrE-like cation transporter
MNYLFAAVAVELVALFFMKKLGSGIVALVPILLLLGSYYIFSFALQSIPLHIAYTVWAGIGIMGSHLIGYYFFKDPMSFADIGFSALILIGIIGLSLKQTSG